MSDWWIILTKGEKKWLPIECDEKDVIWHKKSVWLASEGKPDFKNLLSEPISTDRRLPLIAVIELDLGRAAGHKINIAWFEWLKELIKSSNKAEPIRIWVHYGGKSSQVLLMDPNWKNQWWELRTRGFTLEKKLPACFESIAPYSIDTETRYKYEKALVSKVNQTESVAYAIQMLVENPDSESHAEETLNLLNRVWRAFEEESKTPEDLNATLTVYGDNIHSIQNCLIPLRLDYETLLTMKREGEFKRTILGEIYDAYFGDKDAYAEKVPMVFLRETWFVRVSEKESTLNQVNDSLGKLKKHAVLFDAPSLDETGEQLLKKMLASLGGMISAGEEVLGTLRELNDHSE